MTFSSPRDESSKWSHLEGYMTKWKPRKVSAARSYPPNCGPRARPFIPKAEEHGGASKNVEVDNSEANETVDSGDRSSSTGIDADSSWLINSYVGVGWQFRELETNPAGGVDIKDSIDVPVEKLVMGDEVENFVVETGEQNACKDVDLEGRKSEIGNSVVPGGDGIPFTGSMGVESESSETSRTLNAKWKLRNVYAVQNFAPGFGPSHVPGVDGIPKTVSMGIEIEGSETNETVDAGDGSGCLKNYCNVGSDCRAHETETSPACGLEKLTTFAYGVEDHVTTTGPSYVPSQNKNMVDGRSHLLSSAQANRKPVKLKINFCHRKSSAVRELPVLGNGVGRVHEETNLVSSSHAKDKITPRGTDFTAGKEMRREIVHGIVAAPYCPWGTEKASVNNTDSGCKRKYVSVDSNCSPKHASGGPSKERLFPDRLDTDRKPGELTKRRANINSSTMLIPDSDDSPGKSCDLNPSWRNKAKAVATKSICGDRFSGNKTKEDFPTDSRFIRKRKNLNVRLMPRFDPNSRGNPRSRVRETLMLFHSTCRKLLQGEEADLLPDEVGTSKKSKKLVRIDLKAAEIIKNKGKVVNAGKQILGAVPGVEVGDEFKYRVELAIVGIHRLYQAGIDSMKIDGELVANSIVTSGSYDDDTEHADVLIYSGQGGNIVGKNRNYEDQKLEKGNLALYNSMTKGTPVRVVRGWKETLTGIGPSGSRLKEVAIYYYDGLYTVQHYWKDFQTSHGKMVFKFELTRNPGQPELAWKELKKMSKSKLRRGLCVTDISCGREKLPICAVNELNDDKPPRFTYISKMKYPHSHRPSPPIGCNCVGKCSSSGNCACATRNGGKIPYTYNGCIVEDKLVVYECGPHCKCPPTCYNRVTQRGIKFGLEIFKTKQRGWGVRALTSIPSGGFVCEYVGELLEDSEAEKRVGDDEYLFDIGQNILDSSLNSEELACSADEGGGYTIDACHFGNVGRFINHSCSPNLYAQNVIHDHDDKKMPRIMLFARENIPAFQELTYHYNYKLDQVFHPDGNIKIKKCFCGSAECRGRMY